MSGGFLSIMCSSTISLEESYVNDLKERILLYAKNIGINIADVPLETIIRILIEIRIERLKRERRPLFSKGITIGDSDYDLLMTILNILSDQFWQIKNESSANRKELLQQEAEKQLSQQ